MAEHEGSHRPESSRAQRCCAPGANSAHIPFTNSAHVLQFWDWILLGVLGDGVVDRIIRDETDSDRWVEFGDLGCKLLGEVIHE